jgi:hypothetical protein
VDPDPESPWSSASIRVSSATRDPATVSKALGLEASHATTRGDPISPRQPDGPHHPLHVWTIRSPLPGSAALDAHVEWLLATLQARRDAVIGVAQDCEIALWLGLTASPLGRLHDLDSRLLRQMADLGLSMVIDLYDPDVPED